MQWRHFHIWQWCASGGGVRVFLLLEVCPRVPQYLQNYMCSCLEESLMATCGSVLVELWVWGESI